jgi:transposase
LKKARDEGRTIVWVDQSGFYLLPMEVHTWAPCRQTPVLCVPLTHDHLAAIGGLAPDGRLFVQTQDHAYRSPDVVRFLRVLLRKIAGKLLVSWDGTPIHRGQPIKDFLARGAAHRLHLEQLPSYAPELNPVGRLWNYLKRVELGMPRSARVDLGAATWQRALAPQTPRPAGLRCAVRLTCLVFHTNISKWM